MQMYFLKIIIYYSHIIIHEYYKLITKTMLYCYFIYICDFKPNTIIRSMITMRMVVPVCACILTPVFRAIQDLFSLTIDCDKYLKTKRKSNYDIYLITLILIIERVSIGILYNQNNKTVWQK